MTVDSSKLLLYQRFRLAEPCTIGNSRPGLQGSPNGGTSAL